MSKAGEPLPGPPTPHQNTPPLRSQRPAPPNPASPRTAHRHATLTTPHPMPRSSPISSSFNGHHAPGSPLWPQNPPTKKKTPASNVKIQASSKPGAETIEIRVYKQTTKHTDTSPPHPCSARSPPPPTNYKPSNRKYCEDRLSDAGTFDKSPKTPSPLAILAPSTS